MRLSEEELNYYENAQEHSDEHRMMREIKDRRAAEARITETLAGAFDCKPDELNPEGLAAQVADLAGCYKDLIEQHKALLEKESIPYIGEVE